MKERYRAPDFEFTIEKAMLNRR